MFRLHDNTRRLVCRAAFVLLCVVPTAGVSFWCAGRHLPGRVDAEAARLQAALGLRVSLGDLCHPRPGQTRYEAVELTDTETGRPVFRCRTIDATWRESQDQTGPSLVLTVAEPEIDAKGADQLLDLFDAMLRDRVAGLPAEVRMTANHATLTTPDGPQNLAAFDAVLDRLPEGVRIDLAFQLTGNASEPIQMRIVRNRQCVPPATGFELDTAGAAVPCRLLATWLPSFAPLGEQSRFRGYLWAGETTDGRTSTGWDGELTGELVDVDLATLAGRPLGHQLTGAARLTIHSARFRGGRLEEATGTLAAGPGIAARPLVEALAGELALARGTLLATTGDAVSYEQLAFAFRIDATGLQLRGKCDGPVAGATLVDTQGPLLGEPRQQPVPAAALVRALVPGAEVQIPATRQAERLLGRLPSPATTSAALAPGPSVR